MKLRIRMNREQIRAAMREISNRHDAVLCALAERAPNTTNIDALRHSYLNEPKENRQKLIDGYRQIIAELDSGELLDE